MVCEAITYLNDRTGSSQQAIGKYVEEKYGKLLPLNFRKLLSVQLKNCVKSEKLAKVKNSFKISASEKVKLGRVANKENAAPAKPKVVAKTKGSDLPPKPKVSKKITAKAEMTKKERQRSQLKAPAPAKKGEATSGGAKTKRLSQVKTPDALKKKKALTPVKRRAISPKASGPAAKRARK